MTITLACTICGETKPLTEFLKDPRKSHGVRAQCKKCEAARCRARTAAGYYKTPARLKMFREYQRATRPNARERQRRHAAVYREKYPEKAAAKRAVRSAIESGILVRPSACPECGAVSRRSDGRPGIHAHHHNYTKPLDVAWLCQQCHSDEHRSIRPDDEKKK